MEVKLSTKLVVTQTCFIFVIHTLAILSSVVLYLQCISPMYAANFAFGGSILSTSLLIFAIAPFT
jgi:hypothetical protein